MLQRKTCSFSIDLTDTNKNSFLFINICLECLNRPRNSDLVVRKENVIYLFIPPKISAFSISNYSQIPLLWTPPGPRVSRFLIARVRNARIYFSQTSVFCCWIQLLYVLSGCP